MGAKFNLQERSAVLRHNAPDLVAERCLAVDSMSRDDVILHTVQGEE